MSLSNRADPGCLGTGGKRGHEGTPGDFGAEGYACYLERNQGPVGVSVSKLNKSRTVSVCCVLCVTSISIKLLKNTAAVR